MLLAYLENLIEKLAAPDVVNMLPAMPIWVQFIFYCCKS